MEELKTFEAMNSFAYSDKYQLFYYDVSCLRSTSLTKRKELTLGRAVLLEAKFKAEIKEAKNADQIEKILDHQFRITDKGDTPKEIWLDLVEQIIKYYNLIKGDNLSIPVKLWFKAKRASLTSKPEIKIKGKLKPEKEPINFLEDAVINNDALNKIYNLLIEAGIIDGETKFLKDKKSGKRGHLYSTIILFYEKGYFKREPTPDEYLNICKNTFKAGVSESTARNHSTRSASTLTIPAFISID